MTEKSEYTRGEIKKLKPEIRHLLEKAAKTKNAEEFIQWLQKYGDHLSFERQAQIVAEFKQIVADEAVNRRRRK